MNLKPARTRTRWAAKEATAKSMVEITGPVVATTLVMLGILLFSAQLRGIVRVCDQRGMQLVLFEIKFIQQLALTGGQFQSVKASRRVDEFLVMFRIDFEQYRVTNHLVLASVALHCRDGFDQDLAALGCQYTLYQGVLALTDKSVNRYR